MRYWSDDRTALTVKMWQEGCSASQIAERLGGVTRNAVIGKVHRLKLPKRVDPNKEPAIAQRARAARLRGSRRIKIDPRSSASDDPLGGDAGCRFICGPVGAPACGRELHKRSYCRDHFALCYQVGTRQVTGDLPSWVAWRESSGVKRNIPGAGLP